MNRPKLPPPILITRSEQLRSLASRLARTPVIAVDTESNSLYAYHERVCLIQFSIPEADYLVDPLALDDLAPLAPIFSAPGVEKVFHAAEYDLLGLKRDFEFEFTNLFDTMVAAQVLGYRKVGLGSMLKAAFGVQLEKKYQRANWGQRPLPDHLLAYARLDTHYLIPLRDRLKAELKAMDRLPLAEEDFTRACRVEGRQLNDHGRDCWRINGAHDLGPQQAAVLQELCRYRDRVARSMDRPLFKVIPDHTLLAIAESCPADEASLARIPGMSRGQMRRYKDALLDAVERGLEARPVRPPRAERPSDATLARLDGLRTWRKGRAARLGVDSNVVLPRDILDSLAAHGPSDAEALAQLMRDVPWRLHEYGEEILQTLNHRSPARRRRR